MCCYECGAPFWHAGELAPPGLYIRVDDGSHRLITLERAGLLPASFDGHVACYGPAPRSYARSATEHPSHELPPTVGAGLPAEPASAMR